MLIGTDQFRCPRCGQTKEMTPEHVYIRRDGRPAGYCRPCQADYLRTRWATAPDYVREHRRAYVRGRYAAAAQAGR